MATLRDIKARIKTVANIQKITKAMQLVAAAKMTRAQERAKTVRPYASELEGILGTLSQMVAEDQSGADRQMELAFFADEPPLVTTREQLFAETEGNRPAVVLVTADRGLCGAFNTLLIRECQRFLAEHEDKDVKLITIGRKGHAFYKARKIPVLYHHEGVDDKLNLTEIKEITGRLAQYFLSGEVDSLTIIYARFRKAALSTVTRQQFLPIPTAEAAAGAGGDFLMEPDKDAVFEKLIPLYATTAIFSALADSFASEYGARMAAMQQATKNAEEKQEDLIILRNRMRQATITKELAEIVGGAEALK